MNIEKLIQTVGFILSKNGYKMNYTKLIKLLYLADRAALSESGNSITGDTYVSMKNGPVLSTLYDLIRGKADPSIQNIWNARFSRDGYEIAALTDKISQGELSEWELEILSKTDEKYHDNTYSEMIDFVHDKNNCPEWENPEYTSKPITIEKILEAAGWNNEEITNWSEENKVFAEEEKLLASLKD